MLQELNRRAVDEGRVQPFPVLEDFDVLEARGLHVGMAGIDVVTLGAYAYRNIDVLFQWHHAVTCLSLCRCSYAAGGRYG